MDISPVLLSLWVASLGALLAGTSGTALGWCLSRKRLPGRVLLESAVLLPLVLPPTVVGFYLLRLLSRAGPLGGVLGAAGLDVLFTPWAAVLAATIAALPLVVKATQGAFEAVDPRIEAVARTLRPAGPVFFTVTLPLAWRGVLAGLILAFARGMGEFGITLMLAGSIPGRTQTLPLAIYDAVQASEVGRANGLALVALAIVGGLLLLLQRLPGRR